jgi:hypothetical protein
VCFSRICGQNQLTLGPPPFVYLIIKPQPEGDPLYDKISRVVKVAAEALGGKEKIRVYENIIVIEQKDAWVVSFHVKGNGNVLNRTLYNPALPANKLFIISKVDFKVIRNPPLDLQFISQQCDWGFGLREE